MKLSQLQYEVAEWQKKQPWDHEDKDDPLLGLVEEVGELAHAHLKQKQGIRGTWADHQAAKADAVGDIMIYLADYCERNDLNMQASVETAWKGVLLRDWAKNPEGGK